MEENENHLSADQEYHNPDISAEYSQPDPESEFSSFRQKVDLPSKHEKNTDKIKRLIRYTLVASVSLSLLAQVNPAPKPEPEPELEAVEIQSNLVIDCAVVTAEEPDVLWCENHGGRVDANLKLVRIDCVLVDAEGEETKLHVHTRDKSYLQRQVFRRLKNSASSGTEGVIGTSSSEPWLDSYKMFYSSKDADEYFQDPNWQSFGSVGIHVSRYELPASVVNNPSKLSGASLKEILYFQDGDEYKKTVAVKDIDMLNPAPEQSVSLKATPLGNGVSDVVFRAVIRPQAGDTHHYQFKLSGFCTRWYGSDKVFLGEGWFYAAYTGYNVILPWNTVNKTGGNYVYEYSGMIRTDAENNMATFYSVELHLINETTGWHYLLESELLPVTA